MNTKHTGQYTCASGQCLCSGNNQQPRSQCSDIEEIVLETRQWTPAATPPPDLQDVIVAYRDEETGTLRVDLGYHSNKRTEWAISGMPELVVDVEHWQPLPDPPESA